MIRKYSRTIGQKIVVNETVIGPYKHDDVKPSIEMAAHIAEAFEVYLD